MKIIWKNIKHFKTSKDKFNEQMDELQEDALEEGVWGKENTVEELEEERVNENTSRYEEFERGIFEREERKKIEYKREKKISTCITNFTTNIVFMYATYKLVASKSFL